MKRFALLIFALSALPISAQIQVGAGGSVKVGNAGAVPTGVVFGVYYPDQCGTGAAPSWCAGSTMDAWVNAALAQCGTNSCEVFMPSGTYTMPTGIIIPLTSLKGQTITGAGPSTILNYTGTGDAIAALGTGQSQVGLTLANFQVNITAAASSGIRLRAFNDATLINVRVTGASAGDCLKDEGANKVSIFGGNLSTCAYGIHDVGVTVGGIGYTPNAVNTYGTQLFGNATWGRYVDGTAAAGCGGANGDYGSTYDFNGGSTTGNLFIQCSTGYTLDGNYFEFGAGAHGSQVQLGDSTHQAQSTSFEGNQFFSAGTTTNTINDVNTQFTAVKGGNSEFGAVTNYYNHGTLSRNSSLAPNLASAATNYFAGVDSGNDTFGSCPTCMNYFAPGSRGIAVNNIEGGANHIVMREGANPDGVITEYENQGGTQKAKIDNTGWGYFANYVTGTGGLELGASGQNTDTPVKMYPSVAGQAIFWMHNVSGVLNFTNGAGSGMTPGTAQPFTMNAATGDFAIQGGYKIAANTVIPSTATGFNGAAGTKVQMSDGTSTTGNCAKFSSGVLTDSGITCGGGLAVSNVQITTNTTAVPATTCTASTATTMTGVATTSAIISPTPTTDTSAVTGWGSSGGLVFTYWVTANTFNWRVCNPTTSSITPGGSVTWNVGAR